MEMAVNLIPRQVAKPAADILMLIFFTQFAGTAGHEIVGHGPIGAVSGEQIRLPSK